LPDICSHSPWRWPRELLTEQSTNYAEPSIEDFDERRAQLARALIVIASQEPPPRRFLAGADAIATAEQKVADLNAQIDTHRHLSTSLAFDRKPAVRAMWRAMRVRTRPDKWALRLWINGVRRGGVEIENVGPARLERATSCSGGASPR
jgi:hypothetical protein